MIFVHQLPPPLIFCVSQIHCIQCHCHFTIVVVFIDVMFLKPISTIHLSINGIVSAYTHKSILCVCLRFLQSLMFSYRCVCVCICIFWSVYSILMPLLYCWQRFGRFSVEIKFNICHIGFMSSLYFSSSIILYYPQVLNFTKFNNGEKHQVAEMFEVVGENTRKTEHEMSKRQSMKIAEENVSKTNRRQHTNSQNLPTENLVNIFRLLFLFVLPFLLEMIYTIYARSFWQFYFYFYFYVHVNIRAGGKKTDGKNTKNTHISRNENKSKKKTKFRIWNYTLLNRMFGWESRRSITLQKLTFLRITTVLHSIQCSNGIEKQNLLMKTDWHQLDLTRKKRVKMW